MSATISRRAVLAGAASLPLTALAGASRAEDGALAALERRSGGRLGVFALDTGSGRTVAHRGNERFAMCSTFKLLAGAFVLARVDRGEERLDRIVPYTARDLITYSPVTEKRAGAGMTVGGLCDAAITLSDNTAANLLLASFGGPQGLTAYLRTLGDAATRLDRIEPALNEARPGDPRDTTTPAAMGATLRRLLAGDALPQAGRAQLAEWLIACRTGDARIRAGVPAGWRVGDKTGTGGNGATNDVGIVWPPGRASIMLAIYYAGSPAAQQVRDATVAEAARIALAVLSG